MHALIFSGYDRVGFTDHLSEDPHPLPLVIIAESASSENKATQVMLYNFYVQFTSAYK